MNMRGEISKLSASIKICNNSSEPFSVFGIDKPYVSKWEEVESTLKSVLNTEELEHIKAKVSSTHTSKSRGISKEFLSKLWLVLKNLFEKEIEGSTQLRLQSKDNPLSRNRTTNDRMLRHKRLQSVFFIDTMFETKYKYIRGNKCCQVFSSEKGNIAVHPMMSQNEFETTLRWFCKEVGTTVNLIVDVFNAQKKLSVNLFSDQVSTTLKTLERTTL